MDTNNLNKERLHTLTILVKGEFIPKKIMIYIKKIGKIVHVFIEAN